MRGLVQGVCHAGYWRREGLSGLGFRAVCGFGGEVVGWFMVRLAGTLLVQRSTVGVRWGGAGVVPIRPLRDKGVSHCLRCASAARAFAIFDRCVELRFVARVVLDGADYDLTACQPYVETNVRHQVELDQPIEFPRQSDVHDGSFFEHRIQVDLGTS